MAGSKHILSLYQDGVELKTVLASVSKGKIKIAAIDHATLITPFQHQLGEEDDYTPEAEALESAGDVFGFDESSPPKVDDLEEEVPEDDQAGASMVETTAEEQFEEDETNEDILHSLLTRVPAKRYSHAINLPRSLAHTLHLRDDYAQMKLKDRNKRIFNEIVERLNDTIIPKDHYDCLFTPKGDAYAFVYKSDIPIIHAFDNIQTHLKVKPKFVSVCPDEIALVNLLRYNYDVEAEETIALINIEDIQSSFTIMQGNEVVHFSQSIREGIKSPTLLNAISGRLLYDQDLGGYPDITRIILTGEARQIQAKEFFSEANPGLPVDYFTLNPDKFIVSGETESTFTDYAVPLGLSIQALFPKSESTLAINLLPDYVMRRQKAFKLAWHGMLLLTLIFLVPLGFNWMYQEKMSAQRVAKQKISSLEKSIEDIEWVTYMADSLATAHAIVQENLTNLTSLSEGSLRWSATFEQLFTALDEVNGVWIADLHSKEQGIEISGLSLYRNRIPRLIEYFDVAEISSVVPADVRGKTVYQFNLSINSITSDSGAFDPEVILPPPMPIQSLESSTPITIIDANEESSSLPDTIVELPVEIEPEPMEFEDNISPLFDMEQLADSLLPPEVFDTLMPMTADISRLADSLNNQSGAPIAEPTSDPVRAEEIGTDGSGVPVTALKTHRIKRGETLKIIARKRLGDEQRWREIYNINRDILKNPNRLKLGQVLIVLEDEEELESVTHVIRTGDNLKYLADLYYGDEDRWESIYKLNEEIIPNANQIFPDQVLTIISAQQRFYYPTQSHTIKAGESLKVIAKKYLGDPERWEEVYKLNKKTIKHPGKIFPGQRIKVINETGVKTTKSSRR